MAKNTSVLLGEHFEAFIAAQVESGRYSSASEVVRTALRHFEKEEAKMNLLVDELVKGEKSGHAKDFDRDQNLARLHRSQKK